MGAGLLAVIVVAVVGPAIAPGSAAAATTVAVDTGSTLTVNGPFHGFGLQEDNELLWTAANRRGGAVGPVTSGDEGAGSDFDRIIAPRLTAMHMAFARKFVSLSWLFPYAPCALPASTPTCPGSTGSYAWPDPSTYAPGDTNEYGHPIYTPASPGMEALYADLAVLKASSTRVLLTIQLVPGWMNPLSAYDPPTAANGGRGNVEYRHLPGRTASTHLAPSDPARDGATVPNPAHLALYTRDIAWLVTLLRRHGFDNVLALTMPNEMAGATLSLATRGDVASACPAENHLADAAGQPLPTLLQIYQGVSANLSRYDTQVQLAGPDLLPCDIALAAGNPEFSSLVSFFDYHDYTPASHNGVATAGTELENVVQAIRAARPTGKQVWITEMGNHVSWTCRKTGPAPEGDQWAGLALKAIDAVNNGIAAISVWNASQLRYGDLGDLQNACQRPWGLWGPPPGFRLHLSYDLWTDFMSQTAGETKVYRTSCEQGCAGLHLAVLGDGHGHTTVLVDNTSSSAQAVAVALGDGHGGPATGALLGPSTFTEHQVTKSATPARLGSPGDPAVPVAMGSASITIVDRMPTLRTTVPGGAVAILAN